MGAAFSICPHRLVDSHASVERILHHLAEVLGRLSGEIIHRWCRTYVAIALTVSKVALGKHLSTFAGKSLTTVMTPTAAAARAFAFSIGSSTSGQSSVPEHPGALPPQWRHVAETRLSDKMKTNKKKSAPNDGNGESVGSTREKELVR